MQKLLMLGDTTGSRHVVEYAKSLGIHTIVADYNPPEISKTKLIADEHWLISTADLDALEQKCRETGVTAVITGVSEFNIGMQMKLCSRLGLPCYCAPEVFHYNRDKSDFKAACIKYGVPTAKQYFLSDEPTNEELNAVEYPVVSKSPDRCANIGMSFCHNPEQLKQGIAKAKEASFCDGVVVEEMLTGREYTSFYVIADGKVSLLGFYAMFSQPGKPTNCYSLSITTTDCLERYLKEFDPYAKDMIKGIGCRNGVAWVEMMTDEAGRFCALEMGHRLSGDLIWLPLKAITGFDSLAWMVNYALTGKNDPEKLPVSLTEYPSKLGCSYILWTDRPATITDIIGLDTIAALPGVQVSSLVSPGGTVEAYKYAAVVTLSAETYAQMRQTLEYINQTVKVLDENGKDILIHFDDFRSVEDMLHSAL